MQIINYISNIAMPFMLGFIIINGLRDKIAVFDIFLKGAKDGLKIIISIFPTLIGLFLAISMLRNSGIIEFIIQIISPILNFIKFPDEIVPLAVLRPISGSASMAIATDIMNSYGVDSFIGKTASVIMGSTETTLYTIAIYTGALKIKDTRKILIAALAADITGMLVSVAICRFLS